MESAILIVVIILANLLGAGMALPQAIRLRRTGEVAGISPAWAGISAAANAWWVVYGLGAGVAGVVPVALFSAAVYAAILRRLLHGQTGSAGSLVPAALGVAVLPLPALLVSGWTGVGLVLGVVYGLQLLPAVMATYRAADPAGVSSLTWVLAWTEAALFGLYGVAVGDVGLVMLALSGLVGSSAILVRLAQTPPLLANDGTVDPLLVDATDTLAPC